MPPFEQYPRCRAVLVSPLPPLPKAVRAWNPPRATCPDAVTVSRETVTADFVAHTANVRYNLHMKMTLDQPSSLPASELRSTRATPQDLAFSEEKDPVALADAFTSALRHARTQDLSEPQPPALQWAGGNPADTNALLRRFNEHPQVRGCSKVAAVFAGEVTLTDLSGPRPNLSHERIEEAAAVRRLPAAELTALNQQYAYARAAGRLSSWAANEVAWEAAKKRGDVAAARLCAYNVGILDHMTKQLTKGTSPAPAAVAKPDRMNLPTVAEARASIVEGVAQGRFKPLANKDAHVLTQELEFAEDMGFSPIDASDARRLRVLAAEGAEVKWVITTDGRLSFGPETVTHPAIARGQPVIAAGQAYIYEGVDEPLEVMHLSNHSGHYQPPFSALETAARLFEAHGIPAPKDTHHGHDE